MDAPPRSSSMIDATPRLSRVQSGILWLVIVVGSFGGLLIAANAAFASLPADDRMVYSYRPSDLDAEVRQLPIVSRIPESARDIRIIWNPETGAAAAAWNGPADAAPPEGCVAVADPVPPAVAEPVVRLGSEPSEGLDCGDIVFAGHSGGTYAWTVVP
ncbi:hypothetical protein [Agromyces sp. NPDC056965]|uniref:hypothetical protein n=1 Tax=Agromyces sp. NPDC056965 TaxID=3345983 RepID=UPI0036314457